MRNVLKTVFHTSVLSYAIFFVADELRPGFVSATFSVHWFLLVAIVSGVLWAMAHDREASERFVGRMWRWAWQVVFGVLLGAIIWKHGSSFGDLRIFVTLVGFFVPMLVIKLLTYER